MSNAAHGSHDRGRDNVLAGDQLNVLALAAKFTVHGSAQLGVVLADKADGIHHFLIHNFRHSSLSGLTRPVGNGFVCEMQSRALRGKQETGIRRQGNPPALLGKGHSVPLVDSTP